MNRLSRLFLLAGLPVIALLAASCSSTSDDRGVAWITKVTPYHLQPGVRLQTKDRMIAFEQAHYYHGAIESEDFIDRFGHYFTIFWKTKAKGSQMTVRLQYTQANTADTLHVKETLVSSAKRKNGTKFQVIGSEYSENGPITSWKASLIAGDQTIAESRSFLWK